MAKSPTVWAVIELAGFEGERVGKSGFGSFTEANNWFQAKYDAHDRAILHPEIAFWDDQEGCWSYDF